MARVNFWAVGDRVLYGSRPATVTKVNGSAYYNATRDVAGMLAHITFDGPGNDAVVAEHDLIALEA